MSCKSRMIVPHVRPKDLLLIAGIVWMAAGGNVFNIGIRDFARNWNHNYLYIAGSAAVYFLFFVYIFYPLLGKHNMRISGMSREKMPFYSFFDKKSFITMVCMITFGILLRKLNLVPAAIIGFLYCGIGGALITTGALFIPKFIVWPE